MQSLVILTPSQVFAVGVVDRLELVDGTLASSFGHNCPMTDFDLVVARGSYSDTRLPLSAPIRSNKSALSSSLPKETFQAVTPNSRVRFRGTKFGGLVLNQHFDENVLRQSIGIFHKGSTEMQNRNKIIFQRPLFEQTRRRMFSSEDAIVAPGLGKTDTRTLVGNHIDSLLHF